MHANTSQGAVRCRHDRRGAIGFRRRNHRLEREYRHIRDTEDGARGRPEGRGDGPGRNVRRNQFDRTPLSAVSGSASGRCTAHRRRPPPRLRPGPCWLASIRRTKGLKAITAAYLASIPNGDAKSAGIKLGKRSPQRSWRRAPKMARMRLMRTSTRPNPVSMCRRRLRSPRLGRTSSHLRSRARRNSGQQPPIALNSEQWATDYNEIKDFGGKASSKRSARQTEDARFWLITGPQSSEPVVRQIVAAKKMSLIDTARFMALTAVAGADAAIAVFDAKYHYEFWRPITAIRNGDTDDNPATERDATWQPIDNTPMHPEYPCAHCIISGAVASAIEAALGTADIPEVTMTSPTAPGVTHRWTNIRAYNDEVSNARIWAGFHYRFSVRVGQDMGRKIGEHVVKNLMQPVTTTVAR